MKRQLTAALLCCALLTGCGVTPPAPQPEPSVRRGTVAYVPLDDRPDNVERVQYLANSLGYTLLLPEADRYQTKLDNQPLNDNGTQSGDRAALYQWVLEQEAEGCDRYILFLDQLLSGGLVNSRHIRGENPIPCPDGVSRAEAEVLEELVDVLSADPNNRVFLLDTVMRLAPTCGYDGLGIDEYNHLREYGMQPRPTLSSLTVDSVVDAYPLSADGSALNPADWSVTDAQSADYLSARERKLRLSAEAQELLARPGCESFRLLTGIDDSSAADSIQRSEIALLRQALRPQDAILSGVDDLAFKAVTRLYLDEADPLADRSTICIEYFGGTEDRPACAYDAQPLQDIVAEHLDYFGLQETADAPLHLLVLTQPADEARSASYYRALTSRLQELQRSNAPVILLDASNNRYGTAFHDALTKDCQLGQLLAYSGFLDMAIVTGTALSHGIARYGWLAEGNDPADLANLSWQESLAESILLDFCYRNTVRDDISAWVRQQGGDPNNFYAPVIDTDAAQQLLAKRMADSTKPVLKNFSRSNYLTDLNGGLAGWGSLTLEGWSFPWQRVFEVRMEMRVGTPTKPHGSGFFPF